MILRKNWSIRWKLTAVAMGTTAIALLLTIAGMALFEFIMLRQDLRDEQKMLADLIGENCTAAITFNRADDANSILSSLTANASVRATAIYDGEGNLLAKYLAPGEKPESLAAHAGKQGYRVTAQAMESFHPIMLDGKQIGTMFIRSDWNDLRERLLRFAWATPIIVVLAGGVGLLLLRRLQRCISDPIVSLARISRRVLEENNYTLRAEKYSDDEAGVLTDRFNAMLAGIQERDAQIREHLQEVQSSRDLLEARVAERTSDLKKVNSELQGEMERRQEAETKREQMQANLVEASRKAGMADVATGVLHNVGNVLNSVNVSAQILHDVTKASRVGTLMKTAELLEQNKGNLATFLTSDERGKSFPLFLSMLAKAMVEERDRVLKELEGLGSSIGHIREIVTMQQSLARVAGVMMEVGVGELIEDALKINQAGLNRHLVKVVRDFDPETRFITDRHKVLQMLINLVSNAKYAVDARNENREIRIKLETTPTKLRIMVIDNGVGIDPQNLNRIFGYGFTTKKNGHGFGLHSAALAAKEMGGGIEVHSEGLGKGATFTITLPRNQEVAQHAA